MLMQYVVHCMAQKNVYEMDGQAKMWEDNFWWWRTVANTNRPFMDFWGFLVERQWRRRRGSVTVNCCEPCSKWQCMEWKHPVSGKTKNLNPKTLQVKWFCSCSGTLMGQYWNITMSKAPLLLLIVHWNTDIKAEASIAQQAQWFAVQRYSFAPR